MKNPEKFPLISKDTPSIQEPETIVPIRALTTVEKLSAYIESKQKEIAAEETDATIKERLEKLLPSLEEMLKNYQEIEQQNIKLESIENDIYGTQRTQCEQEIKKLTEENSRIALEAGITHESFLALLQNDVFSSVRYVSLPNVAVGYTTFYLFDYLNILPSSTPYETIFKYFCSGIVTFGACFVANTILETLKTDKLPSQKDTLDSAHLGTNFAMAHWGYQTGKEVSPIVFPSSKEKKVWSYIAGGLLSGLALAITATALSRLEKILNRCIEDSEHKTEEETMLQFIEDLIDNSDLFSKVFVECVVSGIVGDLALAKTLIVDVSLSVWLGSLSFALPIGNTIAKHLIRCSGLFTDPEKKEVLTIMREHEHASKVSQNIGV